MNENLWNGMLLILSLLFVPAAAMAVVRLPAVIGSNMVLQRDRPIPFWGWADPGTAVTVEFAQQRQTTVAGPDGAWRLHLDPLPASARPRDVRVFSASPDPAITITNVLVGEVWLGSGQSNMGVPLSMTENGRQAVAAADDTLIRLFRVPVAMDRQPRRDTQGGWTPCRPATAHGFSAVMYFMARRLRDALDVPVGLIQATQGGAPCIPWASRDSLEAVDDFRALLAEADAATRDPDGARARYREARTDWERDHVPADPGNTGFAQGWAAPGNDRDWDTLQLPRDWDWDTLTVEGGRWFRKDVDIPPAWEGKPLTLNLGATSDLLTVYYQNDPIGSIDRSTPPNRLVMATFEVPGARVRAGRATLAVRALRYLGGGLTGPGVSMALRGPRGTPPIPLAGEWRTRLEFAAPVGDHRFHAPMPPLTLQSGGYPGYPAALYNGMIAPLVPFAIRGACWYQGESNVRSAEEYQTLLPTLIRGWRDAWQQDDFPFWIVQLSSFTSGPAWAELQDAQTRVASRVPNCGLVVTHDIGDPHDIHPPNKRDVGERLARLALARTYGQTGVTDSGPVYRGMTIEAATIRLRFAHAQGLTTHDGGVLNGFTIAGEDRRFVAARARIEGDTIVVWSEAVARPVAVRYAWTGNPNANLVNAAGLPASCFRTDHWPPEVRTRRPRYS